MRWTVYLFLLLKLLQCLSNSHGWVTTTTTTRMLTSTVTTSPAQATTATKTTTVLQGMVNPASFASDDEWHPRDPAFTTPQLLSGVWHQIAQAGTLSKGESMTVLYPQMEADLNTPRYLNLFLNHLDVCKDVCDHFGIRTTLVPYQQQGKIVGFTAKSYQTPKQQQKSRNDGNANDNDNDDDDDEYQFAYDPFWDDGTDFDALYAGVDDEHVSAVANRDPYPTIENKIPDDDEVMIDLTKQWVGTMMANMGICPFTQDADKAGLPLGQVFYCVDRSTTPEDVYARYWKEVVRLEQKKERDLSTSLLIVPEFYLDNVELYESFCQTLTTALTALAVEDLLQLVFFHPHWSFRDGSARAGGDGQAANYARRSPWPMINLLRTNQVRAAQKGIPTGLVYKQNEKTLNQVGVDQLETMLRLRNWDNLQDTKVNRREMDALRIAQDYQATGQVKTEDLSLEYDTTPAANKVDRKQVEQGDLITVLRQALEKRLGKTTVAGQTAATTIGQHGVQPLTGPETSASAMAVDFLLQELNHRIVEASTRTGAPVATTTTIPEPNDDDNGSTVSMTTTTTTTNDDPEALVWQAQREQAREERLAAARRAMLQELVGDTEDSSRSAQPDDRMGDVLFGKSGIAEPKKDHDEDDDLRFPKGLDPRSFY